MYLVLMVTYCNTERSVSKLKLIENSLRTCMTQERLVDLAILSIESDSLHDIAFTVIINHHCYGKLENGVGSLTPDFVSVCLTF